MSYSGKMIQTNQAAMLSNKTILITRPVGREKHLCQLIEQCGGHAVHYPLIQIQSLTDNEIAELRQLQDHVQDYTMAIFISKTAVQQTLLYFSVLPENLTIVSIGSKTTEALEHHNIHVDIEAPDHNTESLLQMPEFHKPLIQGQRILIFRGTGGRALLGDTLKQRGAEIYYVETYKRGIPAHEPLTQQQINSLDAITISSNEGLDNLLCLMGGAEQLIDIPLVLPAERSASLARQYGFKAVIIAENATDEATFTALTGYFSSPH
jgi:uroporphyrinogen-III synthase